MKKKKKPKFDIYVHGVYIYYNRTDITKCYVLHYLNGLTHPAILNEYGVDLTYWRNQLGPQSL